ncbi:hypothetical protein M404DRAFT_1003522 [Pisolithus tinctorius Marx 270]|uniref:Uncharacterized protein n=1 Tax=Pisolithus tinctorius Marx 270 TaxID=870435 RepID=A0A0C3NII8_PISTI|nr:hypothetical protein M404DRAFT_1003522 [Pisolithus tinctorius Marx 270]
MLQIQAPSARNTHHTSAQSTALASSPTIRAQTRTPTIHLRSWENRLDKLYSNFETSNSSLHAPAKENLEATRLFVEGK